jgi:hypothetical protein
MVTKKQPLRVGLIGCEGGVSTLPFKRRKSKGKTWISGETTFQIGPYLSGCT